jgi:hypothetical protein
MSRVFVARDEALGRCVVLKMLPPELVAGVNADRFEREIRMAAELDRGERSRTHVWRLDVDRRRYRRGGVGMGCRGAADRLRVRAGLGRG